MKTAATLCSVATILGLALAPNALASTEPGVNATPHNQGGETWSHNGCSYVPDSGTITRIVGAFPNKSVLTSRYDFHHACIHHDGCYGAHWADRATCDQWFLNDMIASCAAIGGNELCYERAHTYYRGVRVLGTRAYARFSISVSMRI